MEGRAFTEQKVSFQKKVLEIGNKKPLFFVISFLVVGLAVPLLTVFLIKSPSPDQHVIIFGISYYKLVFIFLLSAALVVHTSLFFLGTKTVTILVSFVLSLYCCFPLVVGLRNNLTLQQAIVDISFFENLPFFLRPTYVLLEFLIPAGIVIYLFLQIKSIFSKKSHGYVFLGAAVYLAVAASLGFSALIQTQEPNIVTALIRKKADLVEKNMAALFPGTSPEVFSAAKENSESPQSSVLPTSQGLSHEERESGISGTRVPAIVEGLPPEKMVLAELEEKVESLSGKMDRMMVELDQIKTLMMRRSEIPHKESLEEKKADAAVFEKELAGSRPTIITKDPVSDSTAIGDLQQEVRLVAEKISRVLDRLGHMVKPPLESQENLKEDQENLKEDKDAVEEEKTHETAQ